MRVGIAAACVLIFGVSVMAPTPALAKGQNRGIGWIPEETRSGPMSLHSQRFWVEGRIFPDRETTFNGNWRWIVGRDELGIHGIYFDVKNKGTIAGDIRDSRMGDASVVWRHYFKSGSDTHWSIQPGVEFNSWRGLNETSNLSAHDDSPIWTLALTVGQEDEQGISWVIEPRIAGWADHVSTTSGTEIDSFGTVFGVRFAGSSKLATRWWLVGEVTPLISGDNTFDKDTGDLNKEVILNIGFLTITKSKAWAKIGVTNGAGTTIATSMLAAPDVSAGFIIQAGTSF
ncbi:MAG: hypothetical protein ACREJQ_04360 [bacterium]